MDNRVETVKEFVMVKGITGVSDDGMILIELTDGRVIEADITAADMKVFHFPEGVVGGRAVADPGTGILKGFELHRLEVRT